MGFKWRLTVRMFSHSRMSAGRERESSRWTPVIRRSSAGQRNFACQRPTFYHCATQPRVLFTCTVLAPRHVRRNAANKFFAGGGGVGRRAIQPRNERYKPATHAVDADCSYKAIRKTIWKFRTQETDCLATDTGSNSAAVSRYDI